MTALKMGLFIMVAGLYASINSIVEGECSMFLYVQDQQLTSILVGYRTGSFPGPFTCANQAI